MHLQRYMLRYINFSDAFLKKVEATEVFSQLDVLALGKEADSEVLNCLPALNLIRSTKLHLSTEPAFLPNACYA